MPFPPVILPDKEFSLRESYRNGESSFTSDFRFKKNLQVPVSSPDTEAAIVRALKDQVPFVQLPGIKVSDVVDRRPFDVRFDLESGTNKVRVYAEIKQSISPRQLENIAPWIARLKTIEKDAAFAIVSPALSLQAQTFCIEAAIVTIASRSDGVRRENFINLLVLFGVPDGI